jgi:hypothetical protein
MMFSGKGNRFFDSFGIPGKLALLEIRLILRNKRPRSLLMLSLMFLFYGFIFYTPHAIRASAGMYLFVGLLITGIFMFQYGQLVMSWESRQFDLICTSGLRMRDYFREKYWFFFAVNAASFLLTLPYAFYGGRIAIINLSAFLYNSGINTFIILFLGTYNTRGIDLGKGVMFNYEGTNFIHFLMFIPLMGLPYLLWLPFSIMGYPDLGLAAVGLAGAAGLLFSEVLIRSIVKQFNSRKYKILDGLRTT